MVSTFLECSPGSLTREAESQAAESASVLARHLQNNGDSKLLIVDGEREELVPLPSAAAELLTGMLRIMAKGHGLALTPLHAELTTGQAAGILKVSRPYLVKLLESGEIPHYRVGRHRRMRREDVMSYKLELRRKREAILDQMVAESQEMGLYD